VLALKLTSKFRIKDKATLSIETLSENSSAYVFAEVRIFHGQSWKNICRPRRTKAEIPYSSPISIKIFLSTLFISGVFAI
jgi:hypothetical protein